MTHGHHSAGSSPSDANYYPPDRGGIEDIAPSRLSLNRPAPAPRPTGQVELMKQRFQRATTTVGARTDCEIRLTCLRGASQELPKPQRTRSRARATPGTDDSSNVRMAPPCPKVVEEEVQASATMRFQQGLHFCGPRLQPPATGQACQCSANDPLRGCWHHGAAGRMCLQLTEVIEPEAAEDVGSSTIGAVTGKKRMPHRYAPARACCAFSQGSTLAGYGTDG
jgi:hypothetical protein